MRRKEKLNCAGVIEVVHSYLVGSSQDCDVPNCELPSQASNSCAIIKINLLLLLCSEKEFNMRMSLRNEILL